MTLRRYTGPRRAYVGAIGLAAPGGVDVRGVVVLGTSEPATVQLWRDGEHVADCGGWLDGCSAIGMATGERVDVPPCPDGLEVTSGDTVWRLSVT